ncbi:MAG: amino acid ABC transporter permease, partial [Parafannyhessea umbonata]|nr:amino acid ABC transporter permease [Parafannyhessea umbonata]
VAGIYYRQLETYIAAAVCYLILTMIASKLLSMLAVRLDAPAMGPALSSSEVKVTTGVAGSASQTIKTEIESGQTQHRGGM